MFDIRLIAVGRTHLLRVSTEKVVARVDTYLGVAFGAGGIKGVVGSANGQASPTGWPLPHGIGPHWKEGTIMLHSCAKRRVVPGPGGAAQPACICSGVGGGRFHVERACAHFQCRVARGHVVSGIVGMSPRKP